MIRYSLCAFSDSVVTGSFQRGNRLKKDELFRKTTLACRKRCGFAYAKDVISSRPEGQLDIESKRK